VTVRTGAFVVFEGGDGVGKSTQVGLLAERLTAAGHEVVTTYEPGATRLGALLRGVLLHGDAGDVGARAEALLYAADKAEHLHEVVRPALARGAVVVCDRYVDSMVAYQGAGRVLEETEVERIARWATEDLRPDLTVLLDLEPAEGLGGLTEPDRLESAGLDFHARARAFFLALAARDPDRYLVLPARRSRAELAEAIGGRVERVLSVGPAKVSRWAPRHAPAPVPRTGCGATSSGRTSRWRRCAGRRAARTTR
jgi:dTMP kinase